MYLCNFKFSTLSVWSMPPSSLHLSSPACSLVPESSADSRSVSSLRMLTAFKCGALVNASTPAPLSSRWTDNRDSDWAMAWTTWSSCVYPNSVWKPMPLKSIWLIISEFLMYSTIFWMNLSDSRTFSSRTRASFFCPAASLGFFYYPYDHRSATSIKARVWSKSKLL